MWRIEGESQVSVRDLRFQPLAFEREAVFVYAFEVGADGVASEIPHVRQAGDVPEASEPAEAR